MDAIVLSGVRALGVHGVLPEEHARAQPFEVDLELQLDLSRACASDALEDTLDYGEITAEVVRIVTTERHQLIERLAQRIAEACTADDRVVRTVVTVRKLRPPLPAVLDHVAVRIER